MGNFAICHWLYYKGRSNSTYYTLNGATGVNWGETRFYNAYEWGNSGSHITGASIQTAGTSVGLTYGFELSHNPLTTYVAGEIYTMSWYQPKYSESGYAADALRRYNGGNFGTRADKVKAYSISARQLSFTSLHGVKPAD